MKNNDANLKGRASPLYTHADEATAKMAASKQMGRDADGSYRVRRRIDGAA